MRACACPCFYVWSCLSSSVGGCITCLHCDVWRSTINHCVVVSVNWWKCHVLVNCLTPWQSTLASPLSSAFMKRRWNPERRKERGFPLAGSFAHPGLLLCLSLSLCPSQSHHQPTPYMNNITCQINLSHWWPSLYELTTIYSSACLKAERYYFQYWLLYKNMPWIGHAWGTLSSSGEPLPLGCYRGKWYMIKRCWVLYTVCQRLCVCVWEREGRAGEIPYPPRFFCCFFFHSSGSSCGTRWSLLLTRTVCHFLSTRPRKIPLMPN